MAPLPRRRRLAVALLARGAGRLADADPRPPRLGARRPLPRHAGRGDLCGGSRRARARGTPVAPPRGLLRADPAARRHPPGADDIGRDVGLAPSPHERHRLRLAAHLRHRVGRDAAVSVRLRERRLRRARRAAARTLTVPEAPTHA